MHPKKQRAKLIQFVSFEHIQNNIFFSFLNLTHYVPVLPSYINQSIDSDNKYIDWFLYEGNTGT